jgi:TonB family protein
MKKFTITFILLACVCVYGQPDDKATLKTLNQKLVESYKNNKLDEALKFANQAVELSLKIYGTDNTETAVAYSNLGIIQREKQKYKDSILSLQKTVEIYLKVTNLKGNGLIESYQNLALSQFYNGKFEDSISNYLKAIEQIESKFGHESKESFLPTLNVANGYARNKQFEKADEYYLKSYSLAWKNFGKSANQIQNIEDSRICMLPHKNQIKDEKDFEKVFGNLRQKLFAEIFGEQPKVENTGLINGGVINGKATSLPKPAYPQEAKSQRLQGQVPIRVLIDEQGNITEAKAVCGRGYLETASEEAAIKSKFSTTTLNGKPVKVSGIIVYNFVAQ